MNNGLGISFFRHIIEEDDTNWCQIFAKLPFDEVEIRQKGALFGVARFSKNDNWPERDMELTAWVDMYFNSLDVGGDLLSFCNDFDQKFGDSDYIWMWIVGNKDKQEIKVCKKGLSVFFLLRDGKFADFSSGLVTGKVLKGTAIDGDRYAIGVGDVKNFDDINGLTDKKSSGFLVMEIKNIEKNNLSFEGEKGSLKEDEEIKPLESESDSEVPVQPKIVLPTKIATEQYLLKPTITQRVEMFLKRTRSLALPTEEIKIRRKKTAILMGTVFVFLLIVSLFLGQTKKNNLAEDKRWTDFSQPIEKMVDEAVGISQINKVSALKIVEEAKLKYSERKSSFADKTELALLEKKIDDAWSKVSGEINSNLTEVLNLNLIRAGVNASRVSYGGDNEYTVISSDTGLVMGANTETKSINVVAGKGAGLGWIDAVLAKKKTYVLSKGGVFLAGNESNSIVFDSAVTNPISLSVFGANVYVLEKGNREIFKYSITDNGFGERQRWLKDGQNLQGNPVDMDIDVDIWVLNEDGQLERFRRGVKETFVMSGITGSGDFSKISVEGDGDKIALLSVKNASITLCSKETGVCEKQMKNPRLVNARDIVFGDGGVLYVLFEATVEMLN